MKLSPISNNQKMQRARIVQVIWPESFRMLRTCLNSLSQSTNNWKSPPKNNWKKLSCKNRSQGRSLKESTNKRWRPSCKRRSTTEERYSKTIWRNWKSCKVKSNNSKCKKILCSQKSKIWKMNFYRRNLPILNSWTLSDRPKSCWMRPSKILRLTSRNLKQAKRPLKRSMKKSCGKLRRLTLICKQRCRQKCSCKRIITKNV